MMRPIKQIVWIPLLATLLTTLSANEAITIDQQITAMQKASPQERVKLMNQFKQQLASMNAEERSKSIAQLREQMKTETHADNHTQHKEMQSEAQRDQMQQSEHLQRMEQMQQRHGGDQQMHEMENEMGNMENQLPHPSQQH